MSEGGGSETVLRRNLPGTKAADYSRLKIKYFDVKLLYSKIFI